MKKKNRQKCSVKITKSDIVLSSPSLKFHLGTKKQLHATLIENSKTGSSFTLEDSAEVEVDLDTAIKRINITGWRWIRTRDSKEVQANDEHGYKNGFHQVRANDSHWYGAVNAAFSAGGEDGDTGDNYCWLRTHLFVSEDSAGLPQQLILGGFGLYDYRFMRVFLNGELIFERRVTRRWHQPAAIDLGPGSKAAKHLLFGEDNVIALQVSEPILRTLKLDTLDQSQHYKLPYHPFYPSQFEQYLVQGNPHKTINFKISKKSILQEGKQAEVLIELTDKAKTILLEVRYICSLDSPVLLKSTVIKNISNTPIRILNVRLGRYKTKSTTSEGEQGFPVYLDQQLFFALAHPSGWVTGQDGVISLYQYPGEKIAANETLTCMRMVIGVSERKMANQAFLHYITKHSRRKLRGHDKAYAIMEHFGSWDIPEDDMLGSHESEDLILKHLAKVKKGNKQAKSHFDAYFVDFWHDINGNLQDPDPKYFPNGFKTIKEKLKDMGTSLGLWISSTRSDWCNGKNPVIEHCLIREHGYESDSDSEGFFCQATDPFKSIFKNAFIHHIKKNGVKFLKFDDLYNVCNNPHHEHLPGVYSTEAIQSNLISCLKALDAESPDIFLILYWGYRSPWWLLHGDTLSESGLRIEAASPPPNPSLYLRDGITQGIDQNTWYCEDVPPLGKDSLGVWLSAWPWNSMVGKERWQEAQAMDICRGSMLIQPWSDASWLTPAERKEMGIFIALLKAHPQCFANSRFILGNPWRNEPYGYCCTDGNRGFIAINNCTWDFNTVTLQLNTTWGLEGDNHWNIYRWYPHPAQLSPADKQPFAKETKITLRPFEVILLEIVSAGESPSLAKKFKSAPLLYNTSQATQRILLSKKKEIKRKHLRLPTEKIKHEPDGHDSAIVHDSKAVKERMALRKTWLFTGKLPASHKKSQAAFVIEFKKKGKVVLSDHGRFSACEMKLGGKVIPCQPVIKKQGYPSGWQVWRTELPPARKDKSFECLVTLTTEKDVDLLTRVYWIPGN